MSDRFANVSGFAQERAPGLLVAGTMGFVGECVATHMPITLSPLLYATAIGILVGNGIRLVDPEMKSIEPTFVGTEFTKRRLLRAGE